jgi:archaellum component FlaC
MQCECCPFKTLFDREVELRTEERVENIRLKKEREETHKKYKDLAHKWNDLVPEYEELAHKWNDLVPKYTELLEADRIDKAVVDSLHEEIATLRSKINKHKRDVRDAKAAILAHDTLLAERNSLLEEIERLKKKKQLRLTVTEKD